MHKEPLVREAEQQGCKWEALAQATVLSAAILTEKPLYL